MADTDRKLLELAAKAAGIEYAGYCPAGLTFHHRGPWNPIDDDGDALRLAVRLGLEITNDRFQVIVTSGAWYDRCVDVPGASEKKGVDDYAATRRAIVRAAAQTGKLM